MLKPVSYFLSSHFKLSIVIVFILVIALILTSVVLINNQRHDIRNEAASDPHFSHFHSSVSFSANQTTTQSLSTRTNSRQDIALTSTNYEALNINLDYVNSSPLSLHTESIMRMVYPVTAGGVNGLKQYGWTMSKPNQNNIKATINGIDCNIHVGDLNQNFLFYIYYVDFSPITPVTLNKGDSIRITIKNVKIQDLPDSNNQFHFFIDEYGLNNFVQFAQANFITSPPPATSVKLFVDSTFSQGNNVRLHITPIYTGNINEYRYPANDEFYSGKVYIRIGSKSSISPSSEYRKGKEISIDITPEPNCVRNCTTRILNIPIETAQKGYFYFEGRVENGTYDDTFGVSNPSVDHALFFSGTEYENKKLIFGDWHSHYTDNRSTLQENIDYGKKGFRADYVGATNKTNYDNSPHNRQITESDFNEYLQANKNFNEPGKFIALPNEEWPKVLSYYSPIRNTVDQPNKQIDFSHWNWIHQMVLFRDEERSKFFSQENPRYANFFDLVAETRNLNAAMIPHHLNVYNWPYYTSDVQYGMRVLGFNSPEGLWNPDLGADHILLHGAKLGFVGESDSHQGTAGEGGLTGVFVDTFTRDGIINSIKTRDTYASTSFGRPIVLFQLNAPVQAMMGKENIILTNQKPSFKIKVLTSQPLTKIRIRRGFYGGKSMEKVDLDLTSCKNTENLMYECTWKEPSSNKYNFYTLETGTSEKCFTPGVLTHEHCAYSSPIWISRSGLNFVFNDNNNRTGEQGSTVELKTRSIFTPGTKQEDARNVAIYLTNEYPTRDVLEAPSIKEGLIRFKNNFKVYDANSSPLTKVKVNQKENWLKTISNRQGLSVDFKVRYIDGKHQFVTFDYSRIDSCNYRENECIGLRFSPGENVKIYINTDASYSTERIPCTSNSLTRCSYASLDVAKSSINIREAKEYWDLNVIDVTWNISFEPIVGERLYELYTQSFLKTGDQQGWRRAGAVLANPTLPSGELKAVSNQNGVVQLKMIQPATDSTGSIVGVGNVFFRVTDVATDQSCEYLNEPWFSTPAMMSTNGTVEYKLKGPKGKRKICYNFKDAYGLVSEFKTIEVMK